MKTTTRGFTLLELMIVVAICAIAAVIGIIFIGAIIGMKHNNNGVQNYTLGINGLTETRCINGYMFVLAQNGRATEILDSVGKGMPCPTPQEHLNP